MSTTAPELILGPMLRHVTETSATIWVETDRRCTVDILGNLAPTFCVAGHHYALVVIESLQPATSTPYTVRLDGEVRWPAADTDLPGSRIRTLGDTSPALIVFGSCRTAAPHEAPWTLELTLDPRGRGVDALYAYALRMTERPEAEWPALAAFLGDQIYADDSSPFTRERIAVLRAALPPSAETGLPADLVGGFEEYTWLYHESWSPPLERWFFSNVPSVMIFDDHEMIDDWNISAEWAERIRQQAWWPDHLLGGLMSYWLYQHLGNLSPETIREEGLLASLMSVDDGEELLRTWARDADLLSASHRNYRFHFVRDIGRTRLVMIDARNSRVLTPGSRQMVGDAEWAWVAKACDVDVDHLLLGSSLPVFVSGGLHDLQVWDEAICDGSWGRWGRRLGERIRIDTDMEDWPAFVRSFDAMVALLGDLSSGSRPTAPPATISVLSGDIHFSCASEICFREGSGVTSKVHQLVSSPIRNALKPQERTVMRLGTSRFARHVGRFLRRMVRRQRSAVSWKMDRGPTFANSLGELWFHGRQARLVFLQTGAQAADVRPELEVAFEIDLVAGARSQSKRVTGPENADG